MSKLAEMVVDLLSVVSFQPEGGHDPEELAALEHGWWQTLLHDLSPDETAEVKAAMQAHVDELREAGDLPEHLEMQVEALESFISDEMQ